MPWVKTALTMLMKKLRQYLFLVIVSGTVLIFDQVTKALIQRTMQLHESIPIIGPVFSITYIRNPGAAFGLFAQHGNGLRTAFFITISVVAVIFLAALFAKTPPQARLGRLSISLVMGGALGNLIDRLRFGEVIDFLDFYIGRYHWPAFNVADSCISTGVALLIWHFMRQDGIHDNKPSGHA